ncbi:hypothetical protein LCGC14_2079280 [marine sediment metagenome]|uniref:Uncharacterized protein n=1 Tax=marine sediment metagenome TaxID=412755 RepID=A0A0F9HD02_9ZZZZ
MGTGYARLKEMGIGLSMPQARDMISSTGATVIEHDRQPDNLRTCSTGFHTGARKQNRPPTYYEIRGFPGHKRVFVCRYCVYLIAQAVSDVAAGRLEKLLKAAQKEIEPAVELE